MPLREMKTRYAFFTLVLAWAPVAQTIAFQPSAAETVAPVDLDFTSGDWSIHSADGELLGASEITVEASGQMIVEHRKVGDGGVQPIWLAKLEHNKGWTQLFASINGIREFPMISKMGMWPLIVGDTVTLGDGSRAMFRLTISKSDIDTHHRHLEMSRDEGSNWKTVFNYTYRRKTD